MYPNGIYIENCDEMNDDIRKSSSQYLWTVSGKTVEEEKNSKEREHSYNEAIELAGSRWYTLSLVATLSLTLMAMSVDLFGFSAVVALASCDLQLTHAHKQVLLSVPFVGPIVMAYAWGYIADTQGRRRSLLVAMSVSFVMSLLCALAPNWIALAVFKLISTCFCSCAQSVSYALLGESCAERVKSTYLLVMTSVMHLSMGVYFAVAYFVGYLEFSVPLGYITLVPWRALVVLLALPLGFSALTLSLHHESPKFLLNTGRHADALEVLASICRRNRNGFYPVRKVVLDEVGNLTERSSSLAGSLWQQTAPLFKPPLLQRTVLLYYLIFVVYSSSSSLFVWLPFLADDFSTALSTPTGPPQGICAVIAHRQNATVSSELAQCTSKIDLPIVIFAVAAGVSFCTLNFVMSRLAARKKSLMVVILSFSAACCVCAVHVPDNVVNIIAYFGVVSDSLCMGIVFAYCVDFYPTSFRGMAACLGVMVARISSIFGVNLIGAYLTFSCSGAFYGLCGLILNQPENSTPNEPPRSPSPSSPPRAPSPVPRAPSPVPRAPSPAPRAPSPPPSPRASSPLPLATSNPEKSAEEIVADEIELDGEILQLLGDAPKPDTPLGPPIHKDVASRWQDILAKDLTKEVKDKILGEYLVPSNCDFLCAPALNPEAKAALSEPLVKRDSFLMQKQKQLGIALSALSSVTTMILGNETSKQKLLKPISDACRLLCDSYYIETKSRRNLVISSTNMQLKDTLIASVRDKCWLFGENITEKLKAAKNIQRSGDDLKNQPKQTSKPNYQGRNNKFLLNFKAPHRKVDNKPAPSADSARGRQQTRAPPRTTLRGHQQRSPPRRTTRK